LDSHSALISKECVEPGQILFSEETLRRRVSELGAEITRDFAGRDLLLVGMLKGAILFTCDLARAIDLPLQLDFISIAKFRRDGRASGISLLKDLDSDISGRSVLIVEDIIDTGLTTNYLLRNLESRNPQRLSVCTLLDRRSIRIIDVPVEYRGFIVGEDYVVGYGLDCMEQFRDLPFIAKLNSPPKT
jgi:hypoxanthine phosphoribosyltransferase